MTSRIVVTGGCGFVGVPVVRRLVACGNDVTVYDDLSRGSESSLGPLRADVRVIQGDIRDGSLLRRTLIDANAEVVVHLAAMHFIPDCNRDPEACLSINVSGTQQVLESLITCPTAEGFVFASTAAVYAPSLAPHHETSRLAPTDVYGSSKLAAEQLVTGFSERTGMPTGTARLFNVFGPGETNPHLIPTIIGQAREGRMLSLGDLSTARDYVFTEDVAAAFDALVNAARGGRNETCNIGTGRRWIGTEVVDTIARALDLELEVKMDISRTRLSDRPMLCADVSRARGQLGWAPTTTFEEGIRAAIEDPLRLTV
jgi:UDP-glucose 4-epimerase